ncbi:MAG: hypothetical protein ACLS8R_08390 [Anaeromassilibacillus sp.]
MPPDAQVEQMIYEAATNENAAVGHQFAYWRMEDIGRTDGLSWRNDALSSRTFLRIAWRPPGHPRREPFLVG